MSILLGMLTGCSHTTDAMSGECLSQDSKLSFTSGAKIDVPEGVEGSVKDGVATFQIPGDDLKLQIFEFKKTASEALEIVAQDFSITSKAIHSISMPELGWDEVRIEIFPPHPDESVEQLFAKQKGEFTWIFYLKAKPGIFEKRSAQIMSLIGTLEPVGQELLTLKGLKASPIQQNRDKLEKFIQQAMQAADVPGLSIAIVENGETSYSRGFGTLSATNKKRVDQDTRFMIGSTSKSLTTFLLAKLVEQGRLNWNDRVQDIYPAFQLADQKLAAKLVIKDLVSAATGIPRRDLPMILHHQGKRGQDLLDELNFLAPTTKFRETFQYNNQLVAAAGYIAASKIYPRLPVDEGYRKLMNDLVFEPMNMEKSETSTDEAISDVNHAQGSVKNIAGKLQNVDFSYERFAEFCGPGGGIWSTAKDMANYAITELNGGANARGIRVLSEVELNVRREPQVRIDAKQHYGLGWMLGTNTGLQVVHHGGSTIGFASQFIFYPELGNGIVILTNSRQGNYIHGAIVARILELWFNQELKAQQTLDSLLKLVKDQEELFRKNLFTLDKSMMGKVVGSHSNGELGELVISEKSDQYFASLGGSQYPLSGYKDPAGENKIILSGESPMVGIIFDLIFVDGLTLRLARGQEIYNFARTRSDSF